MNGKERFLAVLAGESVDAVPIVPVVEGYFAPKIIGRANDECYLDGGCLADALAAALQRFGYDGTIAEMGLGSHPNVLGCPVEVSGNEVPLVVDTLVKSREDLARVPVPDPWSDAKMEPVKQLVAAVGADHAILGQVRSPFEFAATIRGLMDFMSDFYSDPQLVHDLIAATKPATLAVGHALIDAGCDALVMKESFASCSMISPEHYLEFAFPSEVEVIAELQERAPVILHICRNSGPILAQMAQTGAKALEIDSLVDLAAARQAVGDKVVLKGNIDSVTVIEKGIVSDVEDAVKHAMAAAKADGKFILSTGDSIPVSAPEENVAALVEFGRKYGQY